MKILLFISSLHFVGCVYQQYPEVVRSEVEQEMIMDQVIYSSYIYYSVNALEFNEDSSVLIYRYFHATCHTCIMEDLDELRKFQKRIGRRYILVIPAYPKGRSSEILLKNELSNFRYINIPINSLTIPIDKSVGYKRYFALVGKKGNIEMVFFPRSDYPEMTRKYFSTVKERLVQEY